MPWILRPPSEMVKLPTRLQTLGQSRRGVAVVTALARSILILTVMLGLALAIDALMPLPVFVRVLFLAIIGSMLGVAFLAWLRPAWKLSTTAVSMARLIETIDPRWNDRLASAVAFESLAEEQPRNRFHDSVIRTVTSQAEDWNSAVIVPKMRMWLLLWSALLAVGIVGLMMLLQPSTTGIGVSRLLDPYGNHPWPTATRVRILEPIVATGEAHRMVRGTPMTIRFRVEGELPESATVQIRIDEGTIIDESIPLPEASIEPLEVDHAIEPSRTTRDFAFRVLAHDGASDWHDVRVFTAPSLIPWQGRPSPRIGLRFPDYTQLPPIDLPDASGVIDGVVGTRVQLQATVDRPIVEARLRLLGDQTMLQYALPLTHVVSDNPLSVLGVQQLAQSMTADVPVTISGSEENQLSVDFVPTLAGLYELQFIDEQGLMGQQILDFRLFPDPSPTAMLNRPSPMEDTLTFLPTAQFKVELRAEDDRFGIRSLELEYRHSEADTPQRFGGIDHRAIAAGEQLLVGGTADAHAHPGTSAVQWVLPIAALHNPDGQAPGDGDQIMLRAVSRDWDHRTAGKPPGVSPWVTIQILADDSFNSWLEQQLAKLRADLLRVQEKHRRIQSQTEELTATDKPIDLGQLSQIERGQRELANTLRDPEQGLATQLDRLRDAIRKNNLNDSPVTNKIETINDEMDQIIQQQLPRNEPLLGTLRMKTEQGQQDAETKRLLTQVAQSQQATAGSLQRIMQALEAWGGPGEVRGQARNLRNQLKELDAEAETQTNTDSERTRTAGQLDDLAKQADELLGSTARIAAEQSAKADALETEADRLADALSKAKEQAGNDAESKLKLAQLKNDLRATRQAAATARAAAKALSEATRSGNGQELPNQLRESADDLRQGRIGESAQARQAALKQLDQFTAPLGERSTATPQQRSMQRDAAAESLNELATAQDELRKKIEAAQANPEGLKQLAKEQETLKQQADELARAMELNRDRAAAQAVRRAGQAMNDAQSELAQGNVPRDAIEKSSDEMEQARNQLDQKQQTDEQQLRREKREAITRPLKGIRERQAATLAEAQRLQEQILQAKQWDRGLLVSLSDLQDRQAKLAEELRVLTEQLNDWPIFAALAEQAATAMDEAATRIENRTFDTDPTAPFDAELEAIAQRRMTDPMLEALSRLDMIMQSVEEEKNKPQPQQPTPPEEGQPPSEEDEPQPKKEEPTIPPQAELKALRALQQEIATATARFHLKHPDKTAWTENDKKNHRKVSHRATHGRPTLR